MSDIQFLVILLHVIMVVCLPRESVRFYKWLNNDDKPKLKYALIFVFLFALYIGYVGSFLPYINQNNLLIKIGGCVAMLASWGLFYWLNKHALWRRYYRLPLFGEHPWLKSVIQEWVKLHKQLRDIKTYQYLSSMSYDIMKITEDYKRQREAIDSCIPPQVWVARTIKQSCESNKGYGFIAHIIDPLTKDGDHTKA